MNDTLSFRGAKGRFLVALGTSFEILGFLASPTLRSGLRLTEMTLLDWRGIRFINGWNISHVKNWCRVWWGKRKRLIFYRSIHLGSKKGIGYHHAGMLPTVKETVEKLFSLGLIRIVFATATFSLGINMPAKSVILDELKKRFGRTYRLIPRRDFFQMGGRAGRRGIDEKGYVYSFLNRSIHPHSLRSLIEGAP